MYETTKCSQRNIRTILQCSLQAYARMSTPANMGAQPDWQRGSAWGPVILPVFKSGDSALREPSGGFDSHTLPPKSC